MYFRFYGDVMFGETWRPYHEATITSGIAKLGRSLMSTNVLFILYFCYYAAWLKQMDGWNSSEQTPTTNSSHKL